MTVQHAQHSTSNRKFLFNLVKGRIAVVVRAAGSTMTSQYIKTDHGLLSLSVLPSTILRKHVTNVFGNGFMIDLTKLFAELQRVAVINPDCYSRVKISSHAHIIFTHHVERDRANITRREQVTGEIETRHVTGSRSCAVDRVMQCGVQLCDLLHADWEETVRAKWRMSCSQQEFTPAQQADIMLLTKHIQLLRKYDMLINCEQYLNIAYTNKRFIVIEDCGPDSVDEHPFSINHGSVMSGTGLSPDKFGTADRVGVFKAYCTQAVDGPFPTEMPDDVAELFRKHGGDYDPVTKLPLRCGWLDLVALKYFCMINGITALVITGLNVLGMYAREVIPDACDGLSLTPCKFKLCVAYDCGNTRTDCYPDDSRTLYKAAPVYREVDGWENDLNDMCTRGGVPEYNDIPHTTRQFIEHIELYLQVVVKYVDPSPSTPHIITFDPTNHRNMIK